MSGSSFSLSLFLLYAYHVEQRCRLGDRRRVRRAILRVVVRQVRVAPAQGDRVHLRAAAAVDLYLQRDVHRCGMRRMLVAVRRSDHVLRVEERLRVDGIHSRLQRSAVNRRVRRCHGHAGHRLADCRRAVVVLSRSPGSVRVGLHVSLHRSGDVHVQPDAEEVSFGASLPKQPKKRHGEAATAYTDPPTDCLSV